jgi:tRNA G10  N-methylase Trm11
MQIKPVHPFPARMAPDLAIRALSKLPAGSVVLDPMSGSGTVLRHAAALGHKAVGRDLDPLAVLMTRVWNTPFDVNKLVRRRASVMKRARQLPSSIDLPWIDNDEETTRFVKYWFGAKQRNVLRRIAFVLDYMYRSKRTNDAELDVLRIGLSRIIITKDQGASLARDTSHSRPHRVTLKSNFDVWDAFDRSVQKVIDILSAAPPLGGVQVLLGDARALDIANVSVDAVLTSPPYLNAIDYMRGHRMSLVWLGHRLSHLRALRSSSIGAEKGPDAGSASVLFEAIQEDMCGNEQLSTRHRAMVARYSEDVYRMMSEISRVLKPKGRAILVVGNSCLKGAFIKNAAGVARAGMMVGLRLRKEVERDLPDQHRYLPMPSEATAPLGRRMRTESILTFVRV